MAKYFSGITINGSKYGISIIDDNLNIIFMDNLDIDRLNELLKRKSLTTVSIDSPLALYSKNINLIDNQDPEKLIIKKRSIDNLLSSKQLFTYNSRFNANKNILKQSIDLLKQLNLLGFSIKKPGETEKAIIETYPDTSFLSMGCVYGPNMSDDEILKRKIEVLKSKGIRVKDYLKRNKNDVNIEVNTLCQSYTAYLYYTSGCTSIGNPDDGVLVIPVKDLFNKVKPVKDLKSDVKPNISTIKQPQNKAVQIRSNPPNSTVTVSKGSFNSKVIAEYCGAQYLYTNTDGVIRISELRPIKSYRPFTEIYEIRFIKQVQVIINTTDGLRKVKANLIPTFENSNSFRAAEEEDKKKLDSFWGNSGDKRGYLIKFNKVEIVKA